jgi:hypothetical protein
MSTSVYETFSDIYESVINDAKENTGTVNVVSLVKRWINEGYEVVNFRKRREYLDRKFVLTLHGKVEDTFVVTEGSSIVTHTGTETLLSDSLELGFKVQGFEENYQIDSISSNSVSLTTTYKGDTASAATAVLYERAVIVDASVSEIYDVYHDYFRTPLSNLGPQRLRKDVLYYPERYDKADRWAFEGQEDNTEARRLLIWPYPDEDYTLYYDANVFADELVNASDEPRIPPQYRQILYWYALGKLFGTYHRNATREAVCMNNFSAWLTRMDGKEEVSQDYARMLVDYRRPTRLIRGRVFDSRLREDPEDS